jgi:predicted small secreted protein
MKRAFLAACVAAAVAVAVVGCTTAAGAGSDDAAPADAVNVDAAAPGRALTDAEQLLVDEAQELLIEECMAAAGFRYWPVPVGSVEERQGSGYVLDDVGWAREYGYGTQFQDRLAALQQNDPNHPYANALPEGERLRYSDVLNGNPSAGLLTAELPTGGAVQTPSDSCVAQAKGELYGDFPAWFQAEKVATGLVGLYAEDLVADERFEAALAAWSACMRERGHDYPDPPAIREDLPRLTEGLREGRARAVEKELAVAEATCAVRETALVDTTRDLETEYRDGLPQYRDDVAEYHRLQQVALENAREILARRG